MPSLSLLQRAVFNNARWCDLICRSHGVEGEFSAALWSAAGPTPRFYPNAVTLTPRISIDEMRTLGRIAGEASWDPGIKDSFGTLDLTGMGLQILFEAEWLAKLGSAPVSEAGRGEGWRVVGPADLEDWERCWSDGAIADSVFRRSLFDDSRIRIFAGREAGEIVSGGIAFLSDSAVGVSNIFHRSGGLKQCWTDCVAAVRAGFPGYDLVCYESGAALQVAKEMGFNTLGPLRIWAQSDAHVLSIAPSEITLPTEDS